ncbi:type VI secretion system membrane subunit TssM [Xanthomonas vesicatoria]|uniref:type VI secretion system membrane subunit TssM n=1 Tax=Xanthomonas vesicatoria TaxID=56460 RepID=UPI001E35E4B5|nr:type VI secretion system membrane subunit TssM [Xanthomonas vesicatoria]MCC8618647.1 type VI secretion system membrane subunit TssM [Xanthomonas vesicatoria]MCC8632083.1 type VI secretion system membrane subunit TssM [Xanthomonas vesicatoria]
MTMKTLLSKLSAPLVVSVLALCLVSLLLWVGGPYVAIDGWSPLNGVAARLLAIVTLIGGWLGVLAWRHWRAQRRAASLSSALAAPGRDDDRELRSGQERAQLQARFQQAIQLLRKRRGGSDLYTLPWYALIGPPGSGKSTLLQHSGLQFPLAARMGDAALRGVGGTRDCEWWFTDEAVFLDTAGRYTTQDSDQAVDAGAWRDFLCLLRRHRPRRPLNGVLVTMSMSDLLLLDDGERDTHMQAIRCRLDELAEQLQASVPVYLIFTKCDLIGGFGEFFDDLTPAQRSQVWGMSFPLAHTLDGRAARGFAEEFNLLQQQLSARLFARLNLERDRLRRAAILAFPQQVAALGEHARQFVEGTFAGTAYGPAPLLRGVYFTSGTQEGTPIDRMMGAVARTFGVDDARVHAPGAQRRTFFVERLLREVVLRESGLANTPPTRQRRMAWLQAAAYAGVALLSGALLAGLGVSYLGNRGYLDQVRQALEARPAVPDPNTATAMPDYVARTLQQAAATQAVVQVARQYHPHTPWSLRMGLFQGAALGDELQAGYLRQLNATLLPALAVRFRNGLVDNAQAPQALYYTLKGYLMLGQPQHLDAAQLSALAAIEAGKLFPRDVAQQQALSTQLQAVLDAPERVRALSLDGERIAQARASLRAADLSTLIYGNLLLTPPAGTPLRLDKALGLLADTFVRRSGTALSTPVPALYTQPVFAGLQRDGIGQAVKRFGRDDWVFGGAPLDAAAKAALVREVGQRYEADYIRYWDALLADLQLRPAADLAAASASAAKLAGPSSPLRLLLGVVGEHTQAMDRAPPADPAQRAVAAAAGKAAAKANAAAATLPGGAAMSAALATPADPAATNAPAPGAAISEHFLALNALTAGAPGSTPLDHLLSVLDQLGRQLLVVSQGGGDAAAATAQLAAARQEMAQLPTPVTDWLQTLAGGSATLMTQGARAALDAQVRQSVGEVCSDFVRGRYPFDPEAQVDLPLQNFGELFGTGGRLDALYTGTVQPLLDTQAPQWRWKQGPDAVVGAPGLPAQLQLAQRIRQKYFRGGPVPQVGFTVLAPTLGEGVTRLTLDIEGQRYDYQPGAAQSMPMIWPGPVPGHVSIAAFGADGVALGTLDYQGDWALFRALQAGHLQNPSDLRFVASFALGGHDVQVPLRAGNLRHPFLDSDVQQFACGG